MPCMQACIYAGRRSYMQAGVNICRQAYIYAGMHAYMQAAHIRKLAVMACMQACIYAGRHA